MKKGWEQIFNAKGETLSQPGATPQDLGSDNPPALKARFKPALEGVRLA